MITADKIREDYINGGFEIYKYVRIGDEFRFTSCLFGDHRTLVEEGETPFSAARITINPKGLRVEGNSMMLRIGPAEDDEEKLSALLGIPICKEEF